MARPQVRLTFTASVNGANKSFRVVQDNPDAKGSYTIETAELDAVGGTSWQTYQQVTSAASDRGASKLTPNILTALLDAIY